MGERKKGLGQSSKIKPKENADLLIINAKELLTLAGPTGPRVGRQMSELGTVKDGALAIKEGRIIAVGPTHEISRLFRAGFVINAQGKTVLPGFVDPHTHLVFVGTREDDFHSRIKRTINSENSASNLLMMTIKETRKARVETLIDLGLERLDAMLVHGTTTAEVKSGYGLTTIDELKILEVTKRLNQLHSIDVISTLMPAHAIPPEYGGNANVYFDLVINEILPKVAAKGLAEFCDVSYEKGTFSLEQAKQILVKAASMGLKPKIHADKNGKSGGAEVAASVNAVSADHLIFSSPDTIRTLAMKRVVAVLLPAVAFSLMTGKYADARGLIDNNVPVALGTGFGPDCWLENQQLVITMACCFMHMTPAEAITAATVNAAHAVNRADKVGTLEVGKSADVLILNIPNYMVLAYRFGVNLVDKVIKNGRLVVDREKQDEPIFLDKME
ncbi:MAG: imidazolonepropionase [Chloroflexota bacterium]